MNQFINFIKTISERPSMYVGSEDLNLVRIHLSGYEAALLDSGDLEEKFSLAAFTEWLRKETKMENDWWDGILLKKYGLDKKAILGLPKEYNEFAGYVNVQK